MEKGDNVLDGFYEIKWSKAPSSDDSHGKGCISLVMICVCFSLDFCGLVWPRSPTSPSCPANRPRSCLALLLNNRFLLPPFCKNTKC
ncbi:hypothetical protein DCAR_0522379 [Daucus carota subsp. sativus]|uniref:Uncharacterized protein n=1 Tax=Daucus carota subsp. sativus TaxID=79200 RepID=A0A164ZS32_DAUCS|nr:hypothetical protein DCAR_0522379 [Daucus carota subsp. sativus]